MVTTTLSTTELPEFFRVEGVQVVEESLEEENQSEEEEVPVRLVAFFRGSNTEQEMCNRLESQEDGLRNIMGAVFSQYFTRHYLPELFQHLLCRMNILLNITPLLTGTTRLRYSDLNNHQKNQVRESLTDSRKNELTELLRTFRTYKNRMAYSVEMVFLLNKVIYVLNDVLN